ncbi:MAG: glycosyltransferase [Chloroflexi bacterium]|nr:glycosyltransferase [Chloroflexota bacterium]
MPSYTSIILAVQNQIEWSKLCIDSILKNSEGESYELIIVDNGSDEATASYLDSLPATVIHLETNQGLARAWNTGIRKATGRYLVFLHSDVIVPPRWLPNLLAGFDWLPGNLVCVRSTSLIMELDDRYFEWAEELSNQPAGFVSASQIGSCFVLSRSSLFVLGEFDENFKLPPIVSADLTMRIVKMCGSVLIAGNVLTHHFTARTTLDVFAENRDIIKQDVERLARKHKLPEAASDTIRFSMARWLANARELDGPELGKGDERRDDDKTTKTAEAGGAGRIIACVSLYNDLEVLPGC